jgi:hypothetical protein
MAEAVRVAQRRECKIWTKMDGETNVLYEVYPGGRNARWTLDQLYARENRAAMKPAIRDRAWYEENDPQSLVDSINGNFDPLT